MIDGCRVSSCNEHVTPTLPRSALHACDSGSSCNNGIPHSCVSLHLSLLFPLPHLQPTTTQLAGVLSVSDEYDFWGDVSLSGSRLQTRERAQRFQEILYPLVQEFAHLDSLSHSEVLELIETTQDALDELWKATEVSPPYPEERMAHLLEVVCDTLAHCVQRRLSSLDLWHGPFTLVHRGLHEGLLVCEKCAQVGEVLSGQFWKQFAPHPWKGDRFVSKSLTQFTARLDQVRASCRGEVSSTCIVSLVLRLDCDICFLTSTLVPFCVCMAITPM